MKLKYVGPHEAVEIPALGMTVEAGETVEVTGDMAEEFLKRDDWVRTDKPKTGKGDSA
jgi:hypothetical protein